MTRLRGSALNVARGVLQWSVDSMFRVQCALRDLAPGFRAAWIRKTVFFTLYDVVLPIKLALASSLERILAAQGRVR